MRKRESFFRDNVIEVKNWPNFSKRFLDTGDRTEHKADDHRIEGLVLELAQIFAVCLTSKINYCTLW